VSVEAKFTEPTLLVERRYNQWPSLQSRRGVSQRV